MSSPRDEFLGYVTDKAQVRRQTGINLERLISRIEARYLRRALAVADGDLTRAALWLGYRTPEALKFLLKRHPDIKP